MTICSAHGLQKKKGGRSQGHQRRLGPSGRQGLEEELLLPLESHVCARPCCGPHRKWYSIALMTRISALIAILAQNSQARGFPGGAAVESPPADAGDTGSNPGPERSHMPRSN